MKPIFTHIIFGMISGYFSLVLVLWTGAMQMHARSSFWIYIAYYVCPWLLLFLSVKGWHRARVWRRMKAMRESVRVIHRGHHNARAAKESISVLEVLCLLSILLAALALRELMSGPSIWRLWL